MVIRAGKKIGSIYALVTGYAKFPDVRLAVYKLITRGYKKYFSKVILT